MVTDNNPLHTSFHGQFGVRGTLDSFQHNRQRRYGCEPLQVLPAKTIINILSRSPRQTRSFGIHRRLYAAHGAGFYRNRQSHESLVGFSLPEDRTVDGEEDCVEAMCLDLFEQLLGL